MVAQNMSQVAIESLGPEMTLKIRMGSSTRDWTLSWYVESLYGQSNAGSGELKIRDALYRIAFCCEPAVQIVIMLLVSCCSTQSELQKKTKMR